MAHIGNPTRKGRILSVTVTRRQDLSSGSDNLGTYQAAPGPADRKAEPGGCPDNECRYFIAAMSPEDTGNPESVRQDYARAEALSRGEWCYVGVSAKAEIAFPGSTVVQRLTSGGLWGIESDSGEDDFAEVEAEELNALRDELTAAGFTPRQIDLAFKSVRRESKL